MTDVDKAKQQLRDKVWRDLLSTNAVPADSYGKIPSFIGAEQGAEILRNLDAWRRAATIKANPDYAQLHVRTHALQDGKRVYMAVPKMAAVKPFFLLDPTELKMSPEEAAAKSGAERHARHVGVEEMSPIDVVVCGSVAVNRSGDRLGKGAGYSDLEVAILIEASLITEATVIVAPVHRTQLINDPIPTAEHDFTVDYIVTPDELIRCTDRRRPPGVLKAELTPEKVHAIPSLSTHL